MWVQKVPGGGVSMLAFAPDGRTLYTFDRGRYLLAWDTATRERRKLGNISWKALFQPRALHALADGRRLVAVGRTTGLVLDASDGSVLHTFERPVGYFGDSPCVTPDGRVYFADHPHPRIRGYDLNTGTEEPVRTLPGFSNQIRHFHLAPDERSVAVVFNTFTAELFDWSAGPELRHAARLGPAASARVTPDGATVAVSTSGPPRVAFWDRATRRTRLDGVRCWITDALFAFNPAYPLFATIGEDKCVALFSTESGLPVRALDFSLGLRVQSVAFSPDGLTCAVGGSNKQFAIFDVDV